MAVHGTHGGFPPPLAQPMLPVAFDALVDVMTTKVTSGRLEKERAVVLSEASMVNTMGPAAPRPRPRPSWAGHG